MVQTDGQMQWFVMRDLKRRNAKMPAYKLLREQGMEVFVPMHCQLVTRNGMKARVEVPVVSDLLFVHSTKEVLDPIVMEINTLQYRFLRNCNRAPMTVPCDEMERFIRAVNTSKSLKWYLPEEITPDMYKRKVRIIGGALDGYEGSLITVRGSKIKRLMVELENYLAVGVEINPEFIQLL